MSFQKTYTADFGSTPVSEATFVVSDSDMSGLSYVSAFFMRDSTVDNSVDEHESLASSAQMVCSISGTNLTIYVELSSGFVTGTFKIRYVAV